MRVLAIDPGETSGYVVLDTLYPDVLPHIEHWWQGKATVRERALALFKWLRKYRITHVVVEDFKIHPSSFHPVAVVITNTIEYLGCIEAVCQMLIPPVEVHRVQPNKKGRWPKARLDAKYPIHTTVKGVHAHDALVIGLVYLEDTKLWEV
jgi:hypothetical protein